MTVHPQVRVAPKYPKSGTVPALNSRPEGSEAPERRGGAEWPYMAPKRPCGPRSLKVPKGFTVCGTQSHGLSARKARLILVGLFIVFGTFAHFLPNAECDVALSSSRMGINLVASTYIPPSCSPPRRPDLPSVPTRSVGEVEDAGFAKPQPGGKRATQSGMSSEATAVRGSGAGETAQRQAFPALSRLCVVWSVHKAKNPDSTPDMVTACLDPPE